MAKALDRNQIKNLLRQDSKQQTVSQRAAEWPSREDRKKIHDAVNKRSKTVVLNDEREYSIRYHQQKSVAWGNHDVVFVKPTSGAYVPCGWFRVKSLLAGT